MQPISLIEHYGMGIELPPGESAEEILPQMSDLASLIDDPIRLHSDTDTTQFISLQDRVRVHLTPAGFVLVGGVRDIREDHGFFMAAISLIERLDSEEVEAASYTWHVDGSVTNPRMEERMDGLFDQARIAEVFLLGQDPSWETKSIEFMLDTDFADVFRVELRHNPDGDDGNMLRYTFSGYHNGHPAPEDLNDQGVRMVDFVRYAIESIAGPFYEGEGA